MASASNPFLITVGLTPGWTSKFEAWWDRVVSAWPDPRTRPTCRLVDLRTLTKRIDMQGVASPDVAGGPVLALLDDASSMASVYQLADELQQHRMPGVLLVPTEWTACQDLHESGLIVAAGNASPEFVAAALFTLAIRQTTIRELSRELSIAARAAGGVRGQMDRIHEELNLAAAVQQEMMPKACPNLPGLDCAAMLRPAGYVSGDIYDLVALDEHRVLFYIADAVGHGVPAALMTMVISRALRVERPSEFSSPGETLAKLNDELCRGQRDSGRFTTAVYGVLDTRTRQVTIASAGHPPPLLVGTHGITRVPCEGALMGIFPGEKFENCTFELQPGETLLLFSDGFEVAFSPAPEHGQKARVMRDHDELEHYVQRLAMIRWPDGRNGRSATEAMDELARLIDTQAGSLHQIDDLTAIAISCTADVASGRESFSAAA